MNRIYCIGKVWNLVTWNGGAWDAKRHLEMETNPIVSDRDGSTGTETMMGIIVKEIFINAPPRVVYDFLTDPEKLARWMGVASDQERSGDRKRRKRIGSPIPAGQVQKLLNSKVVFRWEIYAMGASVKSVVQIDLARRGDGTWVRLTHKESPKRLERTSGKRAKRRKSS